MRRVSSIRFEVFKIWAKKWILPPMIRNRQSLKRIIQRSGEIYSILGKSFGEEEVLEALELA